MFTLIVIVCLVSADGRPDYATCERASIQERFMDRGACLRVRRDPAFRLGVQRVALEWAAGKDAHGVYPRVECWEAGGEA